MCGILKSMNVTIHVGKSRGQLMIRHQHISQMNLETEFPQILQESLDP
jgi:hypothetical protein